MDTSRQARIGVLYGLAAYGWWGLAPIYFKAVADVPPFVVLCHRIVWSVVLLILLVRILGRWGVAIDGLRQRRVVVTLIGTTLLIGANWYVFILAVSGGRVLEASLGYFINPLMNVFLGFVFLREVLRPWQWISVALAATGVAYRTASIGQLPLVALFLATSFALYGLLRKTAKVDSLIGLTLETVLLAPAALLYLTSVRLAGGPWFGSGSWGSSALLMLGGVITSVPLLLFASAARRLRYSTLGIIQYVAPSLQGLLAVFAFGEVFTSAHMVSFTCIWTALAIYTVDALRVARAVKSGVGAPR